MSLSLPAILDQLANKDLVLGLLLMTAGIIFMIMGLRVSRLTIIISCGVVGYLGGSLLARTDDMIVLQGLAGALMFGLCSAVLFKPSTALLTGGWGAAVALFILTQMGIRGDLQVAGIITVGVASVSLAYLMHKETIAITTSLEGAMLFIGGLIIFLAQSTSLWGHVRYMMVNNDLFAPFMVLSGTVIGFYFQLADLRQEETGMSL